MDALIRPPRVAEPVEPGFVAEDPSDEGLVALALDGHPGAFDELAARHRQLALRMASAIVGRDDAEDVVQEALLLAFRALPTMRDKTKFSRWLSTITRYRALRFLRSDSRHRRETVRLDSGLLDTLSDLACSPRSREAGDDLLRRSLSDIPVVYAEVIRLHFLHGLPHQRIARLLDVPLSTVKWRCCRGKELLKSALENEGAGIKRLGKACLTCRPGMNESSCGLGERAPGHRGTGCRRKSPQSKSPPSRNALLPSRPHGDAS